MSERLIIFYQDKTPTVALADLVHTLRTNDDIRVLYSPITSTFFELVIESGRQELAIRSTAKIVHDLSPYSEEHLRSGLIDMVIDSNPMQQAFGAVDFVARQYGYVTQTNTANIDFQFYTSENLPLAHSI